MKTYHKKGSVVSVSFILVILFLVFIVIFLINSSLFKEIEKMNDIQAVKKVVPVKREQPKENDYSGEILRKTIWDPSQKFAINVFYAGDKHIAKYKSINDTIYDFTGNVPDGLVKFYDKTRNTHGEEYYKDNKRNGSYKEFYSNGQIKRESQYSSGKMMTNKEYFSDGILRMEEDYTDAMWITKNKEVGQGKVYFRNGKLRYEWSLTNSEAGGFNRSYNQAGEMTGENFFDQNGDPIEKK